jgi:mannose-6-phosphate isomerase-like protein (cupin superfamily)
MSNHTIVNLREVEDSAPKFGYAPDLAAHFASGDLEMENSGVSLQKLAPNFRLPFGHREKEQEELYVVVAGSGRAKLDDEIVEIGAWDALRVPAGVARQFEAGPEGMEYLAFGAPRTGEPDNKAEVLPGWWSD